jgi:hypothetical protein
MAAEEPSISDSIFVRLPTMGAKLWEYWTDFSASWPNMSM